MGEKTEIIARVGTSCRFCGWSGTVDVTEKDKEGRLIVRCPECKERIYLG